MNFDGLKRVGSALTSSMLAFVTLGVLIGSIITTGLYQRYQQELAVSQRVYRLEKANKVSVEKFKIESYFDTVHRALVAASNAPAVIVATKQPGSNVQELHKSMQPLFENLGVKSVYLVSPSSRKLPIQSISLTQAQKSDPRRELLRMNRYFSSISNQFSAINLTSFPSAIGGIQKTADPSQDQRYTPSTFLYGLPLFGSDGRNVGLLAAEIPADFVTSRLSDSDTAVVQKSQGLVAYRHGYGTVETFFGAAKLARPAREVLFSQTRQLKIADLWGNWELWSTKFDSEFWSRSEVAVLKSNLISGALTVWGAILASLFAVSRLRKRQEERFQGMLRNSTEVILLCDANGEVRQVGGQTRELLGWRNDELNNVSFALFVDSEFKLEFLNLLAEVASTKFATASRQLKLETPEKTSRWHEVTATNMLHEAEVGGIVVTLRNIEAQKTSEELLLQAKESAEKANLAKSEFLSRMSHELRTPLNAILGFSQLLELSDLSEPDRESVGQVLQSGRHLLGLINDILDISRIETNNISVSKEPVLVSELIDACLSNVQLIAAQRGIKINIRCDENVYMRADRQRIAQVVINLLSNAVKYNRENGEIFIEVASTQSDVYLSVRDTGMGIPDENLPRLFTPFDRLGADRSTVEGTGLGLSLSKTLVEAMDGRINVLSTLGEGTTFVVALPLAAPKVGVALKLIKGFDQNEIRILCIEDNPVNLQLVRDIFARYSNIKMLEATEGWVGVSMARDHVPDLILLDNNLPDIDAVRVIEELKSNPMTKNIDVYVCSADVSVDRIDACLAAGACDYIQKPIDFHHFFSILRHTREAA